MRLFPAAITAISSCTLFDDLVHSSHSSHHCWSFHFGFSILKKRLIKHDLPPAAASLFSKPRRALKFQKLVLFGFLKTQAKGCFSSPRFTDTRRKEYLQSKKPSCCSPASLQDFLPTTSQFTHAIGDFHWLRFNILSSFSLETWYSEEWFQRNL